MLDREFFIYKSKNEKHCNGTDDKQDYAYKPDVCYKKIDGAVSKIDRCQGHDTECLKHKICYAQSDPCGCYENKSEKPLFQKQGSAQRYKNNKGIIQKQKGRFPKETDTSENISSSHDLKKKSDKNRYDYCAEALTFFHMGNEQMFDLG